MNSCEQKYRSAISQRLNCNPDDIFFYWKGRVALYALLKSMGVSEGDEVIVQGYTCVVVANAILYLGGTPVYVDIDKDTYNMNMDALRAAVNANTKVIICQNTYGLSSNLETIAAIAREASQAFAHPVYTLEDCTHGFGGSYHGRPNGTSCDASFFSTQWSKPYSTGVGGFCAVHNAALKGALLALEGEKLRPGGAETFELWLMYFVRRFLINEWTYWPLVRLYRWLSHKNIVVGSSSGEEVDGIEMPDGFFKAQSRVQFRKGLRSLARLDAVNELRKRNARRYTEFLAGIGKNRVDPALFDDHIFIRYPLLVNSREEFRAAAENANVVLGEWFEGPIYPAVNALATWKLDPAVLPVATYVCDHIVNLPTDIKDIDKVLAFLEERRGDIVEG